MIKKTFSFIKTNWLLLLIAIFSFVAMVNAIEARENSERAYDYAADAASYASEAADNAQDASDYAAEAASNSADAADYAVEAADAANNASINAMIF